MHRFQKIDEFLKYTGIIPFTYCTCLGHLGQSNTNETNPIMCRISKGRKASTTCTATITVTGLISKSFAIAKRHSTSFNSLLPSPKSQSLYLDCKGLLKAKRVLLSVLSLLSSYQKFLFVS